jgi:hypothetical protein
MDASIALSYQSFDTEVNYKSLDAYHEKLFTESESMQKHRETRHDHFHHNTDEHGLRGLIRVQEEK